jgi:nicotinate-nucleotide pyrophosphorylase
MENTENKEELKNIIEDNNLEKAKKLIELSNNLKLENITNEYNNIMKDFLKKHNVTLEISGNFLNNNIQIFQYFKLKD